MAAAKKKIVKRTSYVLFQKLSAGVSLVAFVVIIAAGLMAQASVTTIAFRALVVILVVSVVTRVMIQILAAFEEIDSGQA